MKNNKYKLKKTIDRILFLYKIQNKNDRHGNIKCFKNNIYKFFIYNHYCIIHLYIYFLKNKYILNIKTNNIEMVKKLLYKFNFNNNLYIKNTRSKYIKLVIYSKHQIDYDDINKFILYVYLSNEFFKKEGNI